MNRGPKVTTTSRWGPPGSESGIPRALTGPIRCLDGTTCRAGSTCRSSQEASTQGGGGSRGSRCGWRAAGSRGQGSASRVAAHQPATQVEVRSVHDAGASGKAHGSDVSAERPENLQTAGCWRGSGGPGLCFSGPLACQWFWLLQAGVDHLRVRRRLARPPRSDPRSVCRPGTSSTRSDAASRRIWPMALPRT